VTRSIRERVAAFVTGLAAAVVVIALAILPFLTPAWVSFEQGRTHAVELTGYTPAELAAATNAILHDLVLGPPDFAVVVNGSPVLEERERAHMRDVRVVFAEFYGLAILADIALAMLGVRAYRTGRPAAVWRAVGAGMRWLIVAVVVAGVIATFFFDQAFEIFHQLFFPSGSYDFDPRVDHLVQLFPFDFWSETTLVLGALIIGLAVIVWWLARAMASRSADPVAGLAGVPATSPAVASTEQAR
jgi:integral membrane protein (TIGR01906 family)